MGIFSGILCLICFCLLSAKAVTARLHFEKADKMLMKAHKPASAFLLIICLIHIFNVVPILKNRNLLVAVSGIAIAAFMSLLICLCHIIKVQARKMMWHRILSILMAIGIIWHFTEYLKN